jgi:hypothetical protein
MKQSKLAHCCMCNSITGHTMTVHKARTKHGDLAEERVHVCFGQCTNRLMLHLRGVQVV